MATGRAVRGFTIIELLVAITIIAILLAVFGTVAGNMIQKARIDATRATILKIDGLLRDRTTAFHVFVDGKETLLRQEIDQIQQGLRQDGIYGVRDKFINILVRKFAFRQYFPQQFQETTRVGPSTRDVGPDGAAGVAGVDDDGNGTVDDDTELGWPTSDDPDRISESSEVLYFALTRLEVFGVPPVAADEFSTSEVADTDNDGLLEFIDAWGNPLRFYRWPTRLIRPGGPGNSVNRNVADLLIKGLPAPPPPTSNERDPLNEDSDDPLSMIQREIDRLGAAGIDVTARVNETNWHTFDTYHVPLIVSTGSDATLGLLEPYDSPNHPGYRFGNLAQPDMALLDALTDNITNRNQRAGGN